MVVTSYSPNKRRAEPRLMVSGYAARRFRTFATVQSPNYQGHPTGMALLSQLILRGFYAYRADLVFWYLGRRIHRRVG
jgi:hypothetical protein